MSTEEDLHRFKISDVVLPLPGHAIVFPEAKTINQGAYEEALKQAGISSLSMLKNQAQRMYSLAGGYRRFIHVPGNVEHKLVRYDQVAPLVENGLVAAAQTAEPGKHAALVLGFTLGFGSYATMAVRELCR